MKKFQEPPFKQNAIALGFTLGVHVVAIVGLLFLGLSKPPEQPKKLTTILVKPEDLPPPMAKPVEQETTAENQAEEILSPVVDNTQPENVPVTPPTPTAQQLADAKQKAKEAAQAKQAEEQSKIAAKQRADEEVKRQTEQATADKAAKDKAAADKAAKDKAAADKAAKDKAAADKAAKDKAAADKAAKDKAAADKAAKDKAAADKAAKDKAAADKASKDKAAADKAAKDKAAADKAAKDKADAERAEADAKAAAAKKAEQEAAQKKADVKKIASTAKRDFTNKVYSAWKVPLDSRGKTVGVRFLLSDSGQIQSIVITRSSGDDELDASIKAAIQNAAPYPMPEDPDARRDAKNVTSNFTAK